MDIRYETTVFLMYIFIGLIISFVFDIFRAMRKAKGKIKKTVYIDDILFFLISGTIIIIANIFYTKEMIRLHLIIAILLGILMYIYSFENSIMQFIFKSLTTIAKFIVFIILPIKLQIKVFGEVYNFLHKFIKKCCKMLNDMLVYFYNLLKVKINMKKLFKTQRRNE